MKETQYRVWDLPLRVFHWLLVILIAVSIYTGENGGFKEIDYHMLSGYTILALILFRIIWGFLGSKHARFSDFVRPTEVLPYARTLFTKQPATHSDDEAARPGHNPLGGLSVIAILLVLLVQAGTGLFANDDIFLEGPLTHLVDDETSDDLTSVHHFASKALYVLIGLHLVAITFYQVVRRESLLLPMITGKLKGPTSDTHARPMEAKPVKEKAIALALMAICAGFVYYLINEV